MATSKKPASLQKALSSENIKIIPIRRPPFIHPPTQELFRRTHHGAESSRQPMRPINKKNSVNVRSYDLFVRDTFHLSRTPLFRSRSYFELCPLGFDPEPRDYAHRSSDEPLAPLGTFGEKPIFKTQIDYNTFQLRRPRQPSKKRYGDYNPIHIQRPLPVDKRRGDRDLERRIDEQRTWRGSVKSVYPSSWENAYLFDPTRFKTSYSLLPNSSTDTYSFSNPRAHKAALMAATLRTSPDFWKYTFPHEYQPSWRLAHLEYYFTHGYPDKVHRDE